MIVHLSNAGKAFCNTPASIRMGNLTTLLGQANCEACAMAYNAQATAEQSASVAEKDAVRVIEAASKPNASFASGAAKPTAVWYSVIRYTRNTYYKDAFVLARFRFEADAIAYADSKRSLGTDYHYSIKAGR